MLAWSLLCVVSTLRVGGAVSCVDACAGCRSERRWELREVYCSMCQECRERRREWTLATSPLRMRAVSEINLRVPKKDECVPLCDRLGSGEVYKLSPIKRRESEQGEGEDTPPTTTSTWAPTPPWPSSPTWDHSTQYPPIYSMAPGAATCVMCQNIPCPEKSTCPPPNQPDCPSTQKPNCPSTCHPNCPTTCQPSCSQNCPPACPPNCPTSCHPYYTSTAHPPHQPADGGHQNEPTYLYIGIPKGLEV